MSIYSDITPLVKCVHCGQWAAVFTACAHCGAPVDPIEGEMHLPSGRPMWYRDDYPKVTMLAATRQDAGDDFIPYPHRK